MTNALNATLVNHVIHVHAKLKFPRVVQDCHKVSKLYLVYPRILGYTKTFLDIPLNESVDV